MLIHTLFTAQQAATYDFTGQTAVVIDVLRATTVMTIALAHGAERIVPVVSPEEAFALKGTMASALLGGERNMDLIAGFDLDNSPLRYTAERVGGRPIIMSTTNGTLAINNASSASNAFALSLLNAPATVMRAIELGQDITIVCAGTDGQFSIEDFLCAGRFVSLFTQQKDAELTDSSLAAQSLYLANKDYAIVRQCRHGRRLLGKGYEADLDFALRDDDLPACAIINKTVSKI